MNASSRELVGGGRALAANLGIVVVWVGTMAGLGYASRCGSPTALAVGLYWAGVALIIAACIALWQTVTWLIRLARQRSGSARWLCTGVATASLVIFVGMVLTMVVLALVEFGPLNCPN